MVTNQKSNGSARQLVVIDADARAARAARTLGCRIVYVQQPGSPVHELVDDDSGYYSVDFTGPKFAGFVGEVLRPLLPTAAVSLTAQGLAAADVVNSLLGTAGTPPGILQRLTGTGPESSDGLDLVRLALGWPLGLREADCTVPARTLEGDGQ
ncbi:hypothetical protein [Streptomyces sp. CB01881]|uniref:hypothetical protein n=1 Tax=Streptomyces sp. CB01881 TaxID=2078691 RepID=UPI000CDC17E2|nr:hypothetical protein [Streptomyces sp. CB01881]AUY53132.1 hypothetical protein C2142_34175 [Streptomyces sp. CB01881]TYC69285.1 hypothetical protein EH183_34240 [Streptomyces sp. CB01881]